MKKRILSTIFICTLFITNIAFWGCSECKIKEWPAPSLDKYINNLRKVITNITKEVGITESKLSDQEKKSSVKKDINSTSSRVTQVYNKMLNFDGYYSMFDFYVMYSLKNDYVQEVWRDYNSLEKESSWLDKYLKYVTKKWYDWVNLSKDKVCSWVEDNCDIEWDILDVIWQVISNHESVKNYYRLSIVGKKGDFEWKLKLVWDDFQKDFGECYNEWTTNNCWQCETWWFTKIGEKIGEISNWQENAKTGMKSWQDAIAILDGTWPDRDNERLERKLLEKEMKRNGTSMNSSDNMLKNLSKYKESSGFSLDNNFITNSFDSLKNTVTSQIKSFGDSITDLFKDKPKSMPVWKISKTDDSKKVTADVEIIIKEIYNKELPYSQIQDTSAEDLQSKIIELHYNMTQSIYSLDKTKKVSEKVCDWQAKGTWLCSDK